MLLDSNVIIYASDPKYIGLREYLSNQQKNISVSIISKLEVLGYHKLKKNEKEYYENFFNSINITPISDSIIERAIQLRQLKKYSIGDSIIAATALNLETELVTNNEADFIGIKKLRIIPIKKFL